VSAKERGEWRPVDNAGQLWVHLEKLRALNGNTNGVHKSKAGEHIFSYKTISFSIPKISEKPLKLSKISQVE